MYTLHKNSIEAAYAVFACLFCSFWGEKSVVLSNIAGISGNVGVAEGEEKRLNVNIYLQNCKLLKNTAFGIVTLCKNDSASFTESNCKTDRIL